MLNNFNSVSIAIGISKPLVKKRVLDRIGNSYDFPTFVSKNAWISAKVKIGKGAIIYPNVSINHETQVDDFAVINMNCAIGHDSRIGKCASLAPGVNLGGFTKIGAYADMGIGSSTIQQIEVGEGAIIGGQTMLVSNADSYSTYIGVPGKKIVNDSIFEISIKYENRLMNKKIWLSSPHLTGEEQKYVKEAFDTNWVAPLGPNVNGLEADICRYTGAKACSALSSGTAALHLALILLGVEPGDEVICSSFTFSASVNPIRYQQAIPILVDSERDTWNMSPELLQEAIEDRIKKGKKPKAIIAVHLYGMPSKMDEILEIGSQYEIPIIEDAAEALGSRVQRQTHGNLW